MTSLYPFQKECVDFHLAHHYSLNCCEMGLGKTRIALESAKAANERLAVFGPTFLRSNWEKEAKEVGIEVEYFPYSTIGRVGEKEAKEFGFWVAEECHYLKNPTAQRTHAFYKLLKACRPKYFLGLTGTPVRNRVPDFWTLLGFCSANPRDTNGIRLEGDLRHYRKFARHFCHVENVPIRGFKIEKFGAIKEDKIEEFKSHLTGKFVRFRVEQVLSDLPEMTRIDVPLNLTPIPGMEAVFEAYMMGRKVDVTSKRDSAALKAPHTLARVKDMFEGGSGPLVIFSDHVEPVNIIAAGLERSIGITGQTPAKVRQDAVEKFQRGDLDFIVATIGALSVGVTMTAAKHVVFNDLSWVPSDNAQAEKRIHRIGQRSACFAHYMEASETDRYIRKTLEEKIQSIRKAVGE
jgi:SWI/SNF-related matrix-associated actin-dependent regulator of chromatin subfamily A-like protein 1